MQIISQHSCTENTAVKTRMKFISRCLQALLTAPSHLSAFTSHLTFTLHQLPWPSIVSSNIPSFALGILVVLSFLLRKFFQFCKKSENKTCIYWLHVITCFSLYNESTLKTGTLLVFNTAVPLAWNGVYHERYPRYVYPLTDFKSIETQRSLLFLPLFW